VSTQLLSQIYSPLLYFDTKKKERIRVTKSKFTKPGVLRKKPGENSGDFYWNQEAFWLSFSEEN
jgi:hypothetical protein